MPLKYKLTSDTTGNQYVVTLDAPPTPEEQDALIDKYDTNPASYDPSIDEAGGVGNKLLLQARRIGSEVSDYGNKLTRAPVATLTDTASRGVKGLLGGAQDIAMAPIRYGGQVGAYAAGLGPDFEAKLGSPEGQAFQAPLTTPYQKYIGDKIEDPSLNENVVSHAAGLAGTLGAFGGVGRGMKAVGLLERTAARAAAPFEALASKAPTVVEENLLLAQSRKAAAEAVQGLSEKVMTGAGAGMMGSGAINQDTIAAYQLQQQIAAKQGELADASPEETPAIQAQLDALNEQYSKQTPLRILGEGAANAAIGILPASRAAKIVTGNVATQGGLQAGVRAGLRGAGIGTVQSVGSNLSGNLLLGRNTPLEEGVVQNALLFAGADAAGSLGAARRASVEKRAIPMAEDAIALRAQKIDEEDRKDLIAQRVVDGVQTSPATAAVVLKAAGMTPQEAAERVAPPTQAAQAAVERRESPVQVTPVELAQAEQARKDAADRADAALAAQQRLDALTVKPESAVAPEPEPTSPAPVAQPEAPTTPAETQRNPFERETTPVEPAPVAEAATDHPDNPFVPPSEADALRAKADSLRADAAKLRQHVKDHGMEMEPDERQDGYLGPATKMEFDANRLSRQADALGPPQFAKRRMQREKSGKREAPVEPAPEPEAVDKESLTTPEPPKKRERLTPQLAYALARASVEYGDRLKKVAPNKDLQLRIVTRQMFEDATGTRPDPKAEAAAHDGIVYLMADSMAANPAWVTRLNIGHEIGHLFENTLSPRERSEIEAQRNHEIATKTGPLFEHLRILRDKTGPYKDNTVALGATDPNAPNGLSEYIAERLARANEQWLKGRIGSSPIERAAGRLRDGLEKVFNIFRPTMQKRGMDAGFKSWLKAADEPMSGTKFAERERLFEGRRGAWMDRSGNVHPLTEPNHPAEAFKILNPESHLPMTGTEAERAMDASVGELSKRGWLRLNSTSGEVWVAPGGEPNAAQRNRLKKLSEDHGISVIADSNRGALSPKVLFERPPKFAQRSNPFDHALPKDIREEADKLGLDYAGYQEGFRHIPGFHLFTPREPGMETTFDAPVGVTKEQLRELRDKAIKEMREGQGEEPKFAQREQPEDRERPVTAALKWPNGQFTTGPVHGAAWEQADRVGFTDRLDVSKVKSGFLTNRGRFVDAEEANRLSGTKHRDAEGLLDPRYVEPKEEPREFIQVADRASRSVGQMSLIDNAYDTGERGYDFNRLKSNEPGKGIGSKLLGQLQDHADKTGIPIFNHVAAYGDQAQPKLIDWYKKRGFEPVDREKYGEDLLVYRPGTRPDAEGNPFAAKFSMRGQLRGLKEETRARDIKRGLYGSYDAIGVAASNRAIREAKSVELDFGGKGPKSGLFGSRKPTAENLADRAAFRWIGEAGGSKQHLQDELVKIRNGVDPKLSAEQEPSLLHAIQNFDRLEKLRPEYNALTKRKLAEMQTEGISVKEAQNFVSRESELPDYKKELLPSVLFGKSSGGTSGRWFMHGRSFETLGDAIAAGYRPKEADIVKITESYLRAANTLIETKKFFRSMKTINDATDGRPLVTDPIQRLLAHKTPVTDKNGNTRMVPAYEQQVPHGYTPVDAGGTRLLVHDRYAPVLKAAYGESAIRSNPAGRFLLHTAGTIKHGLLGFDTFHSVRMFLKGAFFGHTVDYKKGLSLLEYDEKDLGRALALGDITQEEADFVRKYAPMRDELLKVGLNVGKQAEALGSEVVRKLPVIGTFNQWLFQKQTRGIMMGSAISMFERNLARFPELTREQNAQRTAREANQVFGSLGTQGAFKSKTMQDLSRLLFLAPNWSTSQAIAEGKMFGQFAKIPFDLATGKGLRIGNVAQGGAQMVLAMLAANQIANLITRGKPTWENEEDGHKWDAFLPIGKNGMWLDPRTIAAETMHAVSKYAARGRNGMEILSQLITNKLSPGARAFGAAFTGRDSSGRNIPGGVGGRIAQVASDLTPLPMLANPFFRQKTGDFTPVHPALENRPGAWVKQFSQAAGLKLDEGLSPKDEMFTRAAPFRDDRGHRDPSPYATLRQNLSDGDFSHARAEIEAALDRGVPVKNLDIAMGLRGGHIAPETFAGGKKTTEQQFRASLDPRGQMLYQKAQEMHRSDAIKYAEIRTQVLKDRLNKQFSPSH